MRLKASGKPAQQLMSLLWAEKHAPSASGRIFATTRTLIQRGYVVRTGEYDLEVRLTDTGRAEAQYLTATEAGRAYMAEMEVTA